MRSLMIICAAMLASQSAAESVVAAKTLRPRAVITSEDIALRPETILGASDQLGAVIGREVRRAVYAGQPVMTENLLEAALIERNAVVEATFSLNGLTIDTEARALERGAVGDIIRAMNLTSRITIQAEVLEDGRLRVLP